MVSPAAKIIRRLVRERNRAVFRRLSQLYHNVATLIKNEWARIYGRQLRHHEALSLASLLLRFLRGETWYFRKRLREKLEERLGRRYTRRDLIRFFEIMRRKYEGLIEEAEKEQTYRNILSHLRQAEQKAEQYAKELLKGLNRLIYYAFQKRTGADWINWLRANITSPILRDFLRYLYTRCRRETKYWICFDATDRDLFETIKGLRPYARVKLYIRVYGDIVHFFGSDFDCEKTAVDKKVVEYVRLGDLAFEEIQEIVQEAIENAEGQITGVEICIEVVNVAGD